jgi:prophage regulatory protein
MRDVLARNGISRSTLYRRIVEGVHPPPVRLGARARRYPEREVDAVIAARIAGQSDEELRQLVNRLREERKTQSQSWRLHELPRSSHNVHIV